MRNGARLAVDMRYFAVHHRERFGECFRRYKWGPELCRTVAIACNPYRRTPEYLAVEKDYRDYLLGQKRTAHT